MTYIEFLQGMLSSCWSAFDLDLPLIGLSFKDLLVGSFVVIIGVSILKSILSFGLSSGGFKTTMNSGYSVGTRIGDKIYKARYKQNETNHN